MIKTIFVLESTWNSENPLENCSVMPFVSEFAKQRNIKAYHQVFTDSKSFAHWVKHFNKAASSSSLLYIAAHGNSNSIEGLQGHIKSVTVLDALKKAKNIKYLHFGSCLFGGEINLKWILKNAKHFHWAAGYNKSVDWVDSTLFDILLWGRISARDEESKNIKTHTIVKDIVDNQVSGLTETLGFTYCYRYGTKII